MATSNTPKSKKVALAVALATAVAIPSEGLRQIAYRDPVSIWTVCYGTTGPDVVKGKVYSLQECKALLTRDMLNAVEEVNQCVPDAPPFVLAAFGDAAYNLGSKIACNKQVSTAARKLAAKDWAGACRELPKWDKASIGGVLVPLPGLTKRRAKEMELCLTPE